MDHRSQDLSYCCRRTSGATEGAEDVEVRARWKKQSPTNRMNHTVIAGSDKGGHWRLVRMVLAREAEIDDPDGRSFLFGGEEDVLGLQIPMGDG